MPASARGFVLRDGPGRALRISGTNTGLAERQAALESALREGLAAPRPTGCGWN